MAKTTTRLTEEDLQTLKKEIRIMRFVILGFLIVCSGLTFLFIDGIERFYAIGVIIALVGIAFFVGNRMYKKEIDGGTKTVLIGTVTKVEARSSGMNEKETTYYVKIDNDEMQITLHDYDKFKEGQKVELHITEESSTILKLIYT